MKEMAVFLSAVMKLSIFFVIILVPCESFSSSDTGETIYLKQNDPNAVIWLSPNNHYLKENEMEFQIFCYKSIPKTVLQIWRSVDLIFENVPLSYEIFPGVNESDVHEKFISKSIWHASSWISGQKTTVNFPAFSQYCVGIAASDKYAIYLKVRKSNIFSWMQHGIAESRVSTWVLCSPSGCLKVSSASQNYIHVAAEAANYWKLLQTLLGMLLFISAPSLSRNPFFHYTSGISLGVLGSLLVLIYILSRFIPKKSTSYIILAFGYSFILYILQMLYKDLNEIISKYMDLLLAYCLIAAFISFIVCYRLGPVQNVRTFNIIQWSMQTIATLLIYLSSEYREVSTAIILIQLIVRAIPSRWITKFQHIWYRLFPPKVKLLTELEFIEQGHIETKKALENLRKHCSSPDCNVWKTVTSLKDPIRFAEFIETGRHCTDQELLQYNSEDFDENEDEESDTEPLENSYMGYQRNGYLSHR